MSFHSGSVVKNRPEMQEIWRHMFDPWVRKIPCNRKWQHTPVILPGKFHGQRNLVNCVVHEVVKSQTRLCTHHLSCYVADLIKDKRLILSIYLPVVKELNFALKTSSGDKCRPFVLSFFLASLCFSLLSVQYSKDDIWSRTVSKCYSLVRIEDHNHFWPTGPGQTRDIL